ncbi:MAG: hypothetical protein R3E50_14290 [Halioglobus sp.]
MQDGAASRQFCAADCLALVERSPAAVAAQDKAAWLSLFARYSIVEDPVGSAPHLCGLYDRRTGHRGPGCLSRFFDTFIAPNTIVFHVDRDSVCGLHVMRDLTIEITMAPEVVVRVPMHLLYELTVEAGELKIFRLAAHWELWPMLKQQLSGGRALLTVGNAAAVRMLRYQGIGGVAGFMRALSSVGAPGKERATRFAHYFNAGDATSLAGLFASPAVAVAFPQAGPRLSPAALIGQGGTLHCTKLLAAGNVVSATVAYRRADREWQGVALFELDRRSLRIVDLTFYWSGD